MKSAMINGFSAASLRLGGLRLIAYNVRTEIEDRWQRIVALALDAPGRPARIQAR
jgi:hypothetical protein